MEEAVAMNENQRGHSEDVHLDLTMPEAEVVDDAVEIMEDVLEDAHLDSTTLEDAHEKLEAAIEAKKEREEE
jgi:hypothetical protein